MRKRIFALMAFVSLSLTYIGCKSDADDGVGEKPRPSTENSFYFRNGRTHTIHIEEGSTRSVTIDGATNNFNFESPSTALTVTKNTDPQPHLVIHAYDNESGSHDIRITDTDPATNAAKTATLTVVIVERDRGWRGNTLTIENIDGDLTEANSKDEVEVEAPVGYEYQASSKAPAAVFDTRVTITGSGNKVKVKATNHYDESTPLTFKFTKAGEEDKTVVIKKVTKFWNIGGNTVYGLSNATYVTKRSFDMLTVPPKVPYKATTIYEGGFNADISKVQNDNKLYGNAKITKIDLNNVTEVGARAFYGSQNLETVIANKVEKIGSSAFRGTKVSKFNLPELKELAYDSRGNDTYISVSKPISDIQIGQVFPSTTTHIIIGSKLTKIGAWALLGTENSLRELRIGVTTPSQLTVDAGNLYYGYYYYSGSSHYLFSQSPIFNTNNATLYVPTAAVGDWKIRQTWIATSFGDRIRGY
ncbi:leucine-rich repeat protein [Capnocytophaga sp. 051621]|uniref:Leucine-rich repeat protein n=1 Tax=Capnocytophaga periodontitidis TaxID=2795027 RepID=A0ABS0SR14_9FLAO|nr:leucine-rich repeat domain-containing protein [Capnocytophaga periodontitidis]MBI1647699.1 leucine-rich repeat protein [Capnocytophaga periodontitidis]